MTAIRTTILSLRDMQPVDGQFIVQLTGWKATITLNVQLDNHSQAWTLNGIDVRSLVPWEVGNPVATSTPALVLRLGGAIVNGQPVMLNDRLVFATGPGFVSDLVLGCIVQEFIEKELPAP